MKTVHFWHKVASQSKIQEGKPHLKFNFTTNTLVPCTYRPFLKLDNGLGLIFVSILHISTL